MHWRNYISTKYYSYYSPEIQTNFLRTEYRLNHHIMLRKHVRENRILNPIFNHDGGWGIAKFSLCTDWLVLMSVIMKLGKQNTWQNGGERGGQCLQDWHEGQPISILKNSPHPPPPLSWLRMGFQTRFRKICLSTFASVISIRTSGWKPEKVHDISLESHDSLKGQYNCYKMRDFSVGFFLFFASFVHLNT